ncbi:c-type cytochrome [Chitinophaga sp. LS1]|uniref:c-type cytochrome n=1 Tax=Chitinophaga sp. LS1 TaxID=3051176 RepID=UPI002AAAC79A|nr:c-type cytochrome [Chitinophaga sp. LS1]WPV68221.1 c-type cytochrome [Chitinophaga sp. LS1]
MSRSFLLLLLVLTQCKQTIVHTTLPTPDPDNGGLFLPDSFAAVTVTQGIGPARHLAVNDNGDIYVKLAYNEQLEGRGGTVALRDKDGDGKADVVAYFGDYQDEGGLPAGMSIYNGYLYFSTVKYVLRTKLTPGQLIPEGKTDTIITDTDTALFKHWHSAKPLVFDHDGHIYVPFGAPTDAAQDINTAGPGGMPGGKGLDPAPDLQGHGGIWRFDANKTGQTQADGELYATGIRSALGLAWSPFDNTLYVAMNGMDNFHNRYPGVFSAWQAAVLPSEPLLKVTPHSNFGWPYAYFDHMQGKNILAPGYGGDGKITARADSFAIPIFGFPGHWAPMDLLFYEGDQFPERYKNGCFVAFHGSTDRAPYPQAGYIVCFVPFEKGVPTGKWEVFADGFTDTDTVFNTSDARYRPMGLATGPDGSLYIAESNKGKIWRVMYTGSKKSFNAAQLTAMETRKSRTYIKVPDPVLDMVGKGNEMHGRMLYDSYCATCHQRDGKGDNNRYPPLAGSQYLAGDKKQLINIVLNGLKGKITVNGKTFDGVMPAHAAFLDDQSVASIVAYIKDRFNNEEITVTADMVKKERVTPASSSR